MSLLKSHTLSPALVTSNRRNAKKSAGPRTVLGKAWSRLNRLRNGWCSGLAEKHLRNWRNQGSGLPPRKSRNLQKNCLSTML